MKRESILFLTFLLLCILIAAYPVSAIQNTSITINPVGNKHIGEKFTITARTNLPGGSVINVSIYSPAFTAASGTAYVIKRNNGMNSIAFEVDARTFTPGRYDAVMLNESQNASGSIRFHVLNFTASNQTKSHVKTLQEKKLDEKNKAFLISHSINFLNPVVNNFAERQVQHSSSSDYNIARIRDVWQSIYNQWTYTSDPPGFSYFPSAKYSIANGMKGNSLDYAILNAAVIESIGGSSRVVTACAPNGVSCHAYPEVRIPGTLSDVQAASSEICSRYNCTGIYYHTNTDALGHSEYWLNLDWQAGHPGGRLFEDNGTYQVYYPNGVYESVNDTGYSL